ncbi:NtaA/DmoA family FMN-dependent monooxygenase [Rhodococcus sp. 5G237]
MSVRSDHITLAAFASASSTHGSIGAWTHPRTDPRILTADYYINLARTLDRGGFDILFFDDRLAMPAAFGDSPAEAAMKGSRAVKLDLISVLSLVASHTSRIGLGATYSTTYHAPYHVARAFATLDHLSAGRAIWNIVTSLNSNEAENFGTEYLDSSTRYDRADEFLEIVTGLWETWERDALQMDRSTGVFADPTKVHELGYNGKWLSSRGPLTVPQPPQGWPILLQAGQSGRGMEFAGRWADLTFTSPRNIEKARAHYSSQAQLAAQAGRPEGDVKILPAVQVIVAEDNETAVARARYFDRLATPEEELIFLSEQANFDFSKLPMDSPLPPDLLDSIEGARGNVAKAVEAAQATYGPDATLRELAHGPMRSTLVRFVGDPNSVADQMAEWFETRACDGFSIVPADTPGSFEDFARLVIPELRRRELMPELDEAPTLRQRLGLRDRASR